jgi:hypothetical protein
MAASAESTPREPVLAGTGALSQLRATLLAAAAVGRAPVLSGVIGLQLFGLKTAS